MHPPFCSLQYVGTTATVRTLYIGGLPPETDHSTLRRLLSAFRGMVRARVITLPSGMGKGFGYVTFDSEEAANLALSTLDGLEYGAHRLRVAPAV